MCLGSGKPGGERAEEDQSGLSGYVRRRWGKVVSFMARVGRRWEELGQCAHGLMMSLSAAADCVSAVNLDEHAKAAAIIQSNSGDVLSASSKSSEAPK